MMEAVTRTTLEVVQGRATDRINSARSHPNYKLRPSVKHFLCRQKVQQELLNTMVALKTQMEVSSEDHKLAVL